MFRKAVFMVLSLFVFGSSFANGEVLFYDNFTAERLNPKWHIEKGEWKVKNDKLTIDGIGLITVNLGKPQDYTLTYKIKVVDYTHIPGTYSWPEVRFCFEKDKCYLFQVSSAYDFWYLRNRKSERTPFILQSPGKRIAGDKHLGFKKGKEYKVRIELNSLNYRVFWDERMLHSFPSLMEDSLKISFHNNTAGVKLSLDDIKIETSKQSEKSPIDFLKEAAIEGLLLYKNGKSKPSEKPSSPLKEIKGRKVLAELNYSFDTEGFDASLIRYKTNITATKKDILAFSLYGDGSNHTLFLVLREKSGESHLIKLGNIFWKGWKDIKLLLSPLFTIDWKQIDGSQWSGDKNRRLDPPITQVLFGVSNQTDAVMGKGVLYLSSLGKEMMKE